MQKRKELVTSFPNTKEVWECILNDVGAHGMLQIEVISSTVRTMHILNTDYEVPQVILTVNL